MPEPELTKEQRKQLREALISAFPSKSKLKMMLLEELDVRLDIVVGGETYDDTVSELILWAEGEGRLEELISGAIDRVSGNPKLRKFAHSLSSQDSGNTNLSRQDACTTNLRKWDAFPEIDWRGPTEDEELQRFLQREPDSWDVTFLKQGIKQSMSVCRIEVTGIGAIGTGFLITQNLLLTNYHVLRGYEPDLKIDPQDISLRFDYLTEDIEEKTETQIFGLKHECPILCSSPTEKLDYLLLQVEDKIFQAEGIQSVTYNQQELPSKGMGIHILHHPNGETMKITPSSNGITGIYQKQGKIQYVSNTSAGSSGSPCFNDDWQVVALHRAKKTRNFGAIGEGILFSAIYPEIARFLS